MMDDDVRNPRRVGALLWFGVLVIALGSFVFESSTAGQAGFVCAIVVSFVSVAMARPTREERLVRPVGYRIAIGALLVVALAGASVGLVPHASGPSQLLGVYFGIVAVLAYRALVARGPRRAIIVVVIAMWTWLPFLLVTLVGCRRFAPAPHWSELASLELLRLLIMMLPVVAIAALLGWVPRRDDVPDMRVVR